MKKKKYKLHALPTVRAEAEPLVRLTTGGRDTLPEADLGFPLEGALSGMQQGGKESLKYDPARDRSVIANYW